MSHKEHRWDTGGKDCTCKCCLSDHVHAKELDSKAKAIAKYASEYPNEYKQIIEAEADVPYEPMYIVMPKAQSTRVYGPHDMYPQPMASSVVKARKALFTLVQPYTLE